MALGLTALIKRFREETRGIAAVEFALILPLMLLLYIGSLEGGELISADRKVSTVAGTIGDLVARADPASSTNNLTLSKLDDYFAAADLIMSPFDDSKLTQRVTCVQVDAGGKTKIMWSEAHNGATTLTVGDAYPLPSAMIAISKGDYVIVAEASYAFTPLFGIVFHSALNLYQEYYHLPRFGEYIPEPT